MEINTVIATTETFEFAGRTMRFSDDDLLRLAETAKGIPVTVDFNPEEPIGFITSAEVLNGELRCTFDLKERPFGDRPLALAPATIFDPKNQRHERLVECAITLWPQQKSLLRF